jgi:hypothetical protein
MGGNAFAVFKNGHEGRAQKRHDIGPTKTMARPKGVLKIKVSAETLEACDRPCGRSSAFSIPNGGNHEGQRATIEAKISGATERRTGTLHRAASKRRPKWTLHTK